MIWVWVLVATLITLFVWFWSWGNEPTPIHFTQSNTLARVLRVVVMRGVYKADLRGRLELFRQQNKTPTLVFTKSRGRDDEFGVTATVRRTQLPGSQFERLRAELVS